MTMYPKRTVLVQPAPRYPEQAYARAQTSYGYPEYIPPPQYLSSPRQPSYTESYPRVPSFQNQPKVARAWMPAPFPPSSFPPELEPLSQLDRLFIHQQLELVEVITGFETCNKYEIKNSSGETLYLAFEENDSCTLNCCGASRPFVMKIFDHTGQEVIELVRPLRCSSCLCPCCLQEVAVYAPPGHVVGYVKQIWDPCLPRFAIQNAARRDVLRIVGPCFVCSCGGDVTFEVMSTDELYTVGRVSKYWTGFIREIFTDSDDLGIQFPLDLDVKMKVVMLGACFLIDFMFFEHTALDFTPKVGVW